jgi:hypothetical protein
MQGTIILLEKEMVTDLVKEFLKVYGTRKFIAIFTTAHMKSTSTETMIGMYALYIDLTTRNKRTTL